MKELNPQYNPKETEQKIYGSWEKNGFFNPDRLKNKPRKAFSVVLPPPNVTGSLHIGHTLNAVIQDILVRYNRMKGLSVVWIPGTDHAGIATQNVVEKKLRKENISRFDLGREKFIEKIWEWRSEYGGIILNQLRRIGASCDWSRTKFTMDPDYVKAVEKAFVYYFKKGWIYRGERVVNWCPRCKTSLSDLELEHIEEPSKLWYMKYPILGEENKFIAVATTRPETMLGDTAVAVNPRDERYKKLVGKNAVVPLANRIIPVIADNLVDPSFGTGVIKVTPAHDLVDWEIGCRHHLPIVQVIDENDRMNSSVPMPYVGMKAREAREKILSDLLRNHTIEKIEDYVHKVPKCYRCNSTIELIPSMQWFLKMDKLSEIAVRAVTKGKVKFYPKRWEKVFLDWQKNTRDWCISRQLWWGQRLPVWFCEKNKDQFIISEKPPKTCLICKKCRMERSLEVFDTWFSSALWPFAVFGWPKPTHDLKRFFPTSVLVTARDIINLWVARMIFSSLELTKKIPFYDVIINATVLTRDGKRMSKSLGTGIDPMNLVENYGADAVRFGLAWQVTESQDIHFKEDNMLAGKKFCNKIWNASRFVLFQLNGEKKKKISFGSKPMPKTREDKRILNSLNKTIISTEKNINEYAFGAAIRGLYEFFWHDFCDVYIEKAKLQIHEARNQTEASITRNILIYVLANSLKIMHPFIPFVTEQIYQKLPTKTKKFLIVENWPKMK